MSIPQLIITVIDTDEQTFDPEQSKFFQPFSMILYEVLPVEGDQLQRRMGISHNVLVATLESDAGDAPLMGVADMIEAISELISNKHPGVKLVHSVTGVAPENDESVDNAIPLYKLSMGLVDAVAEEFQEQVKENNDDADMHRVASFFQRVITDGAENSGSNLVTLLIQDDSVNNGVELPDVEKNLN